MKIRALDVDFSIGLAWMVQKMPRAGVGVVMLSCGQDISGGLEEARLALPTEVPYLVIDQKVQDQL